MPYYSANMPTVATYFAPIGQDGYGQLSFASGVAVKVRWQVKNDLFRDFNGNQVVSSAVVYVAEMVEVGGRIAVGQNVAIDNALEIRAVGVSPSLRGGKELVKIWL